MARFTAVFTNRTLYALPLSGVAPSAAASAARSRQLLVRHTTGEDRRGLGHPPRDWCNVAQHDLSISTVTTRQGNSCGHQRPIQPLPRPNFVRGISQAFGRNHNPRDQLVGRKDVFALISRLWLAEKLGHGNLPRL